MLEIWSSELNVNSPIIRTVLLVGEGSKGLLTVALVCSSMVDFCYPGGEEDD
jgi:hypothetical protein